MFYASRFLAVVLNSVYSMRFSMQYALRVAMLGDNIINMYLGMIIALITISV